MKSKCKKKIPDKQCIPFLIFLRLEQTFDLIFTKTEVNVSPILQIY